MICIGKLSEKEKEFLCREISDRLKELVNSTVDIKTKDVLEQLSTTIVSEGDTIEIAFKIKLDFGEIDSIIRSAYKHSLEFICDVICSPGKYIRDSKK